MSDLSIFNKVEKRQGFADDLKDTILLKDAVESLFPECNHGYSVSEDTGVESWGGEGDKPSLDSLKAEQTRLQAEYDALEYARNRKAEYDALNQFELISDDTKNGTSTHIDAIDAIKAKYPKP